MPEPQQFPFSKPLEFLQKVKYGGAVGKLTVIAVAAILVLGVAMVSMWGNQSVAFVAVAAILVVVFAACNAIGKTLEKHPVLSLMDGTEIVNYRRIEMAAKNEPSLPPSPSIPDPSPKGRLIEASAIPDEE